MKTTPYETILELRRILGQAQGEFAATIGASKDTVASWVTGRNRLSASFARRIGFATGMETGLIFGKSPAVSAHLCERV